MAETVYLFRPTDKDMRIEYPELVKVEEFNALSSIQELKFVWYYANRTSPLFTPRRGDVVKIKACIKTAFKGKPLTESDYKKYIEGNFPPKIKDAIAVMERYNPSARIRARIAIESIFNNLEASLELDEDMEESMNGDIDQKKKYIDLCVKVSETLPTIVAQLEEGYGIRTSSFFSGDGKGMSVMDMLHTTDNGKPVGNGS